MTNEELINNIWAAAGLNSNELREWRAELLRRLGAAVSASPQPNLQAILKEFVAKYARLNGVREQLATPKYDHYVEGASDFADELEKFFAAAPAQEPPYSRPECHMKACESPEECKRKGICKFHYREERAQEQPVENSLCRWCQEIIRPYGQQYEHIESRLIACRDSEHHVAEPSPQKVSHER